MSESLSRRIPSQLSISSSSYNGKRNSMNRGTSITNLSSQNRKNSFNSLSNSYNNLATTAASTPGSSLTPANISMLNSKFGNNTSYFENPEYNSFHGKVSGNNVGTPGSVTSHSSSFTNTSTYFGSQNRQSFNAPSEFANNGTIHRDLANSGTLHSLHSTDRDSGPQNTGDSQMITPKEGIDFFKTFTSNGKFDEDVEMHESAMGVDDELFNFITKQNNNNPTYKSSLTDGLKNQAFQAMGNNDGAQTITTMTPNDNDSKDLDWLKFEI